MQLDVTITPDTWIQAGGFYKSDGVLFFANSNSNSLGSVTATTGLDLVICDSMSLSVARLDLHLLSVWNSKIPLSSLKQTAANRVVQRSSAVLYLQFNFLFLGKYINWVDPSSSLNHN